MFKDLEEAEGQGHIRMFILEQNHFLSYFQILDGYCDTSGFKNGKHLPQSLTRHYCGLIA